MDNFAINWQNRALMNRIKSAKPKVDTNLKLLTLRTQDNDRTEQRTQQQMQIMQKNEEFVQKLADIYGRKNQY